MSRIYARLILLLVLVSVAHAHTAAWVKGMYCINGSHTVSPEEYENNNVAVNPVYEMKKQDWWFNHALKCDEEPPDPGDTLKLPAGGEFQVEIAHNRGQTTLSFNGQFATEWPSGSNGSNMVPGPGPEHCVLDEALHTTGESDAAGTAFSISYVSNIADVTPENLVVFTVAYNTPWRRVQSYQVPKLLPKCPAGGCICGWHWVPHLCGISNMYMHPYRCEVVNPVGTAKLAQAKPPVYCAGNPSACVGGAKQPIFWNQLEGNNIEVPSGKSPGFNGNCGWKNGAQDDIFVSGTASTPTAETKSTGPAAPPTGQTLMCRSPRLRRRRGVLRR